jgi:hypothetical protein
MIYALAFACSSPLAMDNELLSVEDRRFKTPNAIPPPVSSKKRKSTEDAKRLVDQTNSGIPDKDDTVKRQRSTATDTTSTAKGEQAYIFF